MAVSAETRWSLAGYADGGLSRHHHVFYVAGGDGGREVSTGGGGWLTARAPAISTRHVIAP